MSKSRASREPRDRKSPESATVAGALEQKVLEFAEQLGWLQRTVHARSEGWLDRKALSAQVGRIRDGATELFAHLGADVAEQASPRSESSRGAKKITTLRTAAATVKDRGPVDAPGKRHRLAPAPTHGIKHSDERVAKVVLSRQLRRRARG